MSIIQTTLLIVIIVCLLMMIFVAIYNNFQISLIRIDEAEHNIKNVLTERFNLLDKAREIISNNTNEEKPLEECEKLRSKKIDDVELDKELLPIINEFYTYETKYPKLKSNEQFMNISFSLDGTESELEAFKKYYNDIITDYNKMVKTFPTNLVALCSKYKKKPYFESKKEN